MAINLDDRSVVTELDPDGMLKLVEEFPDQCRKALAIAEDVSLKQLERRPNMVVVAGMGGSAAGGDFVRALFEDHGTVPLIVNRDYGLPSFVGVGDIVFCTSYSGNTEETLAAYADAKKCGAKVIAVTSGGKLKEQALADGFVVYTVPGGQPPRTALGFMLIPVIVACQRMKLIHEQDIRGAIDLLEKSRADWTVEATGNSAKQLAVKLKGTLPIIYGLGTWQGLIANRWRSQINENAKMLTFFNTFPELNHNEILGWHDAANQGVAKFTGVILEDGLETEKMKVRASVTEKLIGGICEFNHVQARGETLLQKMLTLAYFGDFVSIYLARLNGVDPETIEAINKLKEALSKVS